MLVERMSRGWVCVHMKQTNAGIHDVKCWDETYPYVFDVKRRWYNVFVCRAQQPGGVTCVLWHVGVDKTRTGCLGVCTLRCCRGMLWEPNCGEFGGKGVVSVEVALT